MKKIRIEWKIEGQEGYGLWFEDTPWYRGIFERSIKDLNLRYGEGTHWLAVS